MAPFNDPAPHGGSMDQLENSSPALQRNREFFRVDPRRGAPHNGVTTRLPATRYPMLSRRQFLHAALAVPALASAAPLYAATSSASAYTAAFAPRALRFLHTHTGETLAVEYCSSTGYLPDGLATVNQFLRDFRTGEVHDIDPSLLDLLHHVRTLTGSTRPFEVISGFRSPITNATLRQRSEGVAAHSLHMVGQAIDVRLTDVPLRSLRNTALSLKAGGVGYYAASNFVHIDTGRVRFW